MFCKNFFWSLVIWVRNFMLNRYLSGWNADIPRTYLLFLIVDRALCDPFQLLLSQRKVFPFILVLYSFSPPRPPKQWQQPNQTALTWRQSSRPNWFPKVGGYGAELWCPVDTLSSSMACVYNDGKLFTWVIECFVMLYCLGVLFLSPKPLGRPAFFNAGRKTRLQIVLFSDFH